MFGRLSGIGRGFGRALRGRGHREISTHLTGAQRWLHMASDLCQITRRAPGPFPRDYYFLDFLLLVNNLRPFFLSRVRDSQTGRLGDILPPVFIFPPAFFCPQSSSDLDWLQTLTRGRHIPTELVLGHPSALFNFFLTARPYLLVNQYCLFSGTQPKGSSSWATPGPEIILLMPFF